MSEEAIINLIDEIAETAKEAVKRGFVADTVPIPNVRYFTDFTAEGLAKVAKDFEEAGKTVKEAFRGLEDSAYKYFKTLDSEDMIRRIHSLYDKGMKKYGISGKDFKPGDEIVFISNGCAVKDRISRVLVETEKGYQVYIDDAFRSMTELVEHLKTNVHG